MLTETDSIQPLIEKSQTESTDQANNPTLSSNQALFWEYTKSTLILTLTMDNEWGLIPLGIAITKLVSVEASPLITTLLDLAYYTNFSVFLPIMLDLSDKAGALNNIQNKSSEEITNMENQVSKIPRNGSIIGLPIWLAITSTLCFSESLLIQLSINPETAHTTQSFFRYLAAFYLFFLPRLLFEFCLVNFNKQTPAMYVSLASLSIAILLGYLLGFVADLKLAGLTISLGAGIFFTSIGYGFLCQNLLPQFNFFSYFCDIPNSKDLEQSWGYLKEALPVVVVNTTDVATGFVLAILAGQLGQDQLKIQNGATQFLNFNYLLLAAATQTMVINIEICKNLPALPKEKYSRLQKTIGLVITSTLMLQAPLAIFVSVFPKNFAKLIGSATGDNLSLLFYINTAYASYALLNSISFNLLQAMRALDDMWVASTGAFLLTIIGATLSYFFSQFTSLELLGLPLGVSIGESLKIIFLLCRFVLTKKQIAQMIETENTHLLTSNIENHVSHSLVNNSSSSYATVPTNDDEHLNAKFKYYKRCR